MVPGPGSNSRVLLQYFPNPLKRTEGGISDGPQIITFSAKDGTLAPQFQSMGANKNNGR
jgi:hypothetical protein